MKKILINQVLIFCCCFSLLNAQNEDNIWIFGYDSNDYPEYPGVDRTIFEFGDSLIIKNTHGGISLWTSYASICDSQGHLLLMSNGCSVENGETQYVANSSGLNPGYIYDNFCIKDSFGYNQSNNMVMIKKPKNNNQVYLFHISNYFSVQPLISYDDKLLLTTIDMDENKVIEKNVPVIIDTFDNDALSVVRHANGRDWWLVVPKRFSNQYFIVKIDPDDMQVNTQQIGPPTWSGAGGEMVFSPDGSKLARFNTRDDLRIFDFDRCTGTLSNPVYIPIADDADNELFAGLAFSADGRYLYAAEVRRVLQFDMQAADIAGSMTIVAEFEKDPGCALSDGVGYMELGPDGHIYCRPLNGQRCMHRINHPERQEEECEFVQHYYEFDFAYKNLPHFPNFRLGPVDGSPCDTLGIDNHPLAGWRYDRTGGLGVDFTSVSWYEPTEWHWVFGDGSAGSTERNPAHTFPAPGPYDVCLTVSNANGSDTKCKTVWVGTSNLPLIPSKGGRGIRVYPNPASGLVTVDGAPDGALVRVYDRLGRMVLESPLQSGRFDAGALPDGVYVVQVWDELGRTAHCTLVIAH